MLDVFAQNGLVFAKLPVFFFGGRKVSFTASNESIQYVYVVADIKIHNLDDFQENHSHGSRNFSDIRCKNPIFDPLLHHRFGNRISKNKKIQICDI